MSKSKNFKLAKERHGFAKQRTWFAKFAIFASAVFAISFFAWFNFAHPENHFAKATAITSPSVDGLSFTLNNNSIPWRTQASDPGVNLTIQDTNSGSSDYQISGVPTGTTLSIGGSVIASSGTDLDGNPIFDLTPAQAAQNIAILPPLSWTGNISNLTVSRMSPGNNILTDFDNGTFDYIGTVSPQLPAGVTSYTYAANTNPAASIIGGSYTLTITGQMNGNSWRDLRSHTNPYTGPFLGSALATPSVLTTANLEQSGKFLLINAMLAIPPPNTFISFGVNVTPYASYKIGSFVASVLRQEFLAADPSVIKPNVTMIATLANGTDITIGSSGTLGTTLSVTDPATMSDWTQFANTINVGNSTKITISFRNNAPGGNGNGNDIGIDDITVQPMPSVSLAATDFVKVYAVYNVSFDNKCSGDTSCSETPDVQTVPDGDLATKPSPDPTHDGYKFNYWYDCTDGTTDNTDTPYNFTTPITADVQLCAAWTQIVTVTFVPNGGSSVDPQTLPKGDKASEDNTTSTRSGYKFEGWYIDESLTTLYDFSSPVNQDITLYAKWTKIPTPTAPPTGVTNTTTSLTLTLAIIVVGLGMAFGFAKLTKQRE